MKKYLIITLVFFLSSCVSEPPQETCTKESLLKWDKQFTAKARANVFYPTLARMKNWTGRVLLKIAVQSNGTLISKEIVESSGYKAIDDAALSAVSSVAPSELGCKLDNGANIFEMPFKFELVPKSE